MADSPETPEVRIEPATVDLVRTRGQALFELHAAELEPGLAAQLNPNWQTYFEREAAGELIVVAAHAGEDLVGYAVAALFTSPRYQHRLICQQDLLFVAPTWRGLGLGLRLVKALRQEATIRGADELLMHAKVDGPMVKLLELAGLTPIELTFREVL